MVIRSIREVVDSARDMQTRTIAVAAAQDEDVLIAVSQAKKQGIVIPILVGDEEKICEILKGIGENIAQYELIHADSDTECAAKAVELITKKQANCLMKGIMSTADIMRAVINPERGIRTGRLLSHMMFYDVDTYDKMLVVTDGGMNVAPNLAQKADILENAAIALRNLGYDRIYASCVCGAEVVNAKIQATVDAAAIAEMGHRWDPYNMKVIGPVGLDLAISPAACKHKRYEAEGAGHADIVLVPTYEVGNGIGKSLTYFACARSAGIIVGAQVPVVLTSRADSAETKLSSIAIGCMAS